MGTVQAGPCRCTSHDRSNRLLRSRRVLLRVADDYQARRGKYELVHIGLWRCHTFQSLVWAFYGRRYYRGPVLVDQNGALGQDQVL